MVSGLICVPDCDGAAGLSPICSGGAWVCPPGTRDVASCEIECGVQPYEGCVCTPSGWSCVDIPCPAGVSAFDPAAPGNACTVPDASCRSLSEGCGRGLEPFACRCEGGRWQCEAMPIDPVCYCGREPSAGDPCLEERAVCGTCCPAEGEPAWAQMICLSGHWAPLACFESCEPRFCPIDTASLVGRSCTDASLHCGDLCCGTAILCDRGVWSPLARTCSPPNDTCTVFPCGEGTCGWGQYCRSACDAAGRPEFSCGMVDFVEDPERPGWPSPCGSCECMTLPPGSECTMLDGLMYVRDAASCG